MNKEDDAPIPNLNVLSVRDIFEESHVIDGVTHYKPKPAYVELVSGLFNRSDVIVKVDLLETLKAYGLPFTETGIYKPEKDEPSPFGELNNINPDGWITWLFTKPYYTAGLLEASKVKESLCEYLKVTGCSAFAFNEVFFESCIHRYPTLCWVLTTYTIGSFPSLEETHKHGVDILKSRYSKTT